MKCTNLLLWVLLPLESDDLTETEVSIIFIVSIVIIFIHSILWRQVDNTVNDYYFADGEDYWIATTVSSWQYIFIN